MGINDEKYILLKIVVIKAQWDNWHIVDLL